MANSESSCVDQDEHLAHKLYELVRLREQLMQAQQEFDRAKGAFDWALRELLREGGEKYHQYLQGLHINE
jgi:hypothetical protein